MKTNLENMKKQVKQQASVVKETRLRHKDTQRTSKYGSGCEGELESVVKDFRHLHIAYSIMKGNEYRDIEKTVRKGNEPSWNLINSYIEIYSSEENVA